MIRRPFGSIDPNSIRETELHTESRRRLSRGERESLHSPQLDRERDAARQRAAATRREQWTVLSGTSTIGHGLHVADRPGAHRDIERGKVPIAARVASRGQHARL